MPSLRTTTLTMLRRGTDGARGVLTNTTMPSGHRLSQFHETFRLSPGDMRIGFHTK